MATAAEYQLIVGACTDVGKLRTRNEDTIYAEPPDSPEARQFGWLSLVADGLGGQASGDVASQLAAQTTRRAFYTGHVADTGQRLLRAVLTANAEIVKATQRSLEHQGMATTITAAVVRGDQLVVAHVGDSRAYLIRGGRIRRVTQDHSLVDDLLQRGQLTPEQAKHHPQRNVITRALGTHGVVDIDISEETLRDQDVILLCSDGLYRFVEEVDIARSLVAEPQQAAEQLVALANERGGADNISVVLVRYSVPSASSI